MCVHALKSYPLVSLLLAIDFNKGVMEIRGKQVDCAAGYHLKVPCIHHLYRTKKYIENCKRWCQEFESAWWSQIYTGRLKELTDTTCSCFSVHIIECNLYCNYILGQ